MTRRALSRYGRLEVGQLVLYTRLVPAPTPEPSATQWGRDGHVVTVRTRHVIEQLQHCDSSVLATLRHADGSGAISACFDSYGGSWGGFGGLDVERGAPYQAALPGVQA